MQQRKPWKRDGVSDGVAEGGTGATTAAGARTNLAAAPNDAKYLIQQADGELASGQAMGALGTGIVKNTTTSGVQSIAAAGTDYRAADVEVVLQAVEGATDTAVGDGIAYFAIPSQANAFNLTAIVIQVVTAGTTNTTDIQIHNLTQAADMLSTVATIDSTETSSGTAAAAAVIDTANDDVATDDIIRVDVDAVSTTAAKGLIVRLVFSPA